MDALGWTLPLILALHPHRLVLERLRRSPEDLAKLQPSVLAQARSKAGQRLEEIGRALKTDTSVLKRPVAMLLAARKLKTIGQRRGTCYAIAWIKPQGI